MATLDFTDYFLYRWRYVIGYSAVAILLAGLLLFAGFYVPGGLSEQEMASVVESQRLDYSDIGTLAVLNLPYHALQDGLLKLFGPSIFVIKLPSLIFAILSALGLIALLRRWFKPNIAVIASVIAISTSQFVFIAQLGTPDIMYSFWPITILLLGTLVTRSKNEKYRVLWKVLFGISVALSLYTPLSVYTLLTVLLTISLHPHLRAIIRRLSKQRVMIALAASSLILVPLVVSAFNNPRVLLDLFGIPNEWPNILENIQILLQQYFVFWEPGAITLMTPVFGLGSFILILLGLWRLIKTMDTTRSYLIVIWLACLLPVLVINPTITNVTFTLSVFLIAAGLTSLIGYWYRLFPRNPYARVSGLVPIIVLVVGLIGTGVTRYVYGYHFSPPAVALFSNDLRLVPKDGKQLVVSDKEQEFYTSIASYRHDFVVSTEMTADEVVVAKDADVNTEGYEITKIITNGLADKADRFYVYKKVN